MNKATFTSSTESGTLIDGTNSFVFSHRRRGENVSTTEVAGALSLFRGLDEVNVYGVTVPGHEGRVGMASVIVREKSRMRWNELYAFLEKNLPVYARPLFIRVQQEMQQTSTFKHTKNDLVKQGFNPHEVRRKTMNYQ